MMVEKSDEVQMKVGLIAQWKTLLKPSRKRIFFSLSPAIIIGLFVCIGYLGHLFPQVNLFSTIAAILFFPTLFLFIPFLTFLKTLKMIEGDIIRTPNLSGALLVCTIYFVVIYLLWSFIAFIKQPAKKF